MRRHAHPVRRPGRPLRVRVTMALVAALGVVVLLAGAALVSRPSSATSAGGPDGAQADASQQPSGLPATSLAPDAAAPMTDAGASTAAPAATSDPVAAAAAKEAGLWPAPPPPSTLTGYVWPIAHPRLTLPFGPTGWGTRLVDGQLFHDGVDLATFCGDRIVATHDGLVLAAGRHFDDYIGWVGDLGPYYRLLNKKQMWPDLPIVVIIDDGNGYRSVYAHFWKIVVKPGHYVRAGQLIGYEGMSGHATGCHLHYGMFSPLTTAMFGIKPSVVKDLHVPAYEIARIDPLLVLPYRKGISTPPVSLGSG